MDIEARAVSFMPGTPYIGVNLRITAPHDNNRRGALLAWDVVAGKPAWKADECAHRERRSADGRRLRLLRHTRWMVQGSGREKRQAALAVPCSIWDRRLANQLSPVLFDDAVAHAGLHRLQHLSFLLSALAFWWALVRRAERLPH